MGFHSALLFFPLLRKELRMEGAHICVIFEQSRDFS